MQTKESRQKAAAERQAAYDLLTIEQKLARPELGAKERAKLLKKQAASKGKVNA